MDVVFFCCRYVYFCKSLFIFRVAYCNVFAFCVRILKLYVTVSYNIYRIKLFTFSIFIMLADNVTIIMLPFLVYPTLQ